MHEVGIAQALLATAERAARDARLARVTRLRIALGARAGVSAEALSLALEVAGRGTCAEGAACEFETATAPALAGSGWNGWAVGPCALPGDAAGRPLPDEAAHDHAAADAAVQDGEIRVVWIEGEEQT